MDVDDETPEAGESGNMYMFEGKDYSKEPSAEDVKAFENLLKGKFWLIC